MSKRTHSTYAVDGQADAPPSTRPYTGYNHPTHEEDLDHEYAPDLWGMALVPPDSLPPDLSQFDQPDGTQLHGQSFPHDTPSYLQEPAASGLSSPAETDTGPLNPALVDNICRRVAQNLTTRILQFYGSDLSGMLSSLAQAQSPDHLGTPSTVQDASPSFAPSQPLTGLVPAAGPPQSLGMFPVPGPIPAARIPQALNLPGPVIPTSSTPAPSPSIAHRTLAATTGTRAKSASVCWWDKLRNTDLLLVHNNMTDIELLRRDTFTALDALRHEPAVYGVTAAHHSFGQLIRAVWTPSSTTTVLQIAICIIMYIAVPPEQRVVPDRPKYAVHRDELPGTWAAQSRNLLVTWKRGCANKTWHMDCQFLYDKYAAYVPEVQVEEFEKRMCELVKYGGCYAFIAWQLGLGTLVALRSRIEPDQKHMWGGTKGNSIPGSYASQAVRQFMEHFRLNGIPQKARDSGADRLMHDVLWQIGSIFAGFERPSEGQNTPFPGFEDAY